MVKTLIKNSKQAHNKYSKNHQHLWPTQLIWLQKWTKLEPNCSNKIKIPSNLWNGYRHKQRRITEGCLIFGLESVKAAILLENVSWVCSLYWHCWDLVISLLLIPSTSHFRSRKGTVRGLVECFFPAFCWVGSYSIFINKS